MSIFSVGSTLQTDVDEFTGQSFSPATAGPSGSGSPGGATNCILNALVMGFPFADTSNRPGICYLYSAPLGESDVIGSLSGLITQSTGVEDANEFGSDSYTRRYKFGECPALKVNETYYAYFNAMLYGCLNAPSEYTAGNLYDDDQDPTDQSAQFLADMTT
jgi:hypothetical protein